MKKNLFIFILFILSIGTLTYGQESRSQDTSGVASVPSVPGGQPQPKNPLTLLMSTFNTSSFREALFQEQNRFKLLRQGFASPMMGMTEQSHEEKLIQDYSSRITHMVFDNLKDTVKENAIEALEDSPFSKIMHLAHYSQKITDKLKTQPSRKIAMSFKPNLQEPSLGISNFIFDKVNVGYNMLEEKPTFFMEQKIGEVLSSQLYYNMFLKTLDTALKKQITEKVNLHIINRNQFTYTRDKSVILGVSVNLN